MNCPNPCSTSNHRVWRIEQVERLACDRLIVGPLEMWPYDYTEAVERRLGPKRVTSLRSALIELRDAIDEELEARGLTPGEAGDLDERAN